MSAQEETARILSIAQDKLAGFLAVSDNDHKYIHEGKGFTYIGNTGSIAAAGTYYLTFKTPPASSGKYVHFRPVKFSSTANILLLQLAKQAVPNSIGTEAKLLNRNHNFQNTPGYLPLTKLYYGGSVTSDGTFFDQGVAGAGGVPSSSGGGQTGGNQESVLLPDTYYVAKFTNIGSTTATVGYFEFFIYEESAGF